MCHFVVSSVLLQQPLERVREMGERFFRNELPEFVPEESDGEDETVTAGKDSLTKLLSLPYKSFSEKLQSYALSLKDKVTHFSI